MTHELNEWVTRARFTAAARLAGLRGDNVDLHNGGSAEVWDDESSFEDDVYHVTAEQLLAEIPQVIWAEPEVDEALVEYEDHLWHDDPHVATGCVHCRRYLAGSSSLRAA